jgi:hypothetical protein
VYRSRHVGGLIEVSGTEDGLASLAGVIADEASARLLWPVFGFTCLSGVGGPQR